jgi:ribosome-associated heat shock protein Hsp15
MSNTPDKVRLDKWLWAARFFKTRSLAKKAIEGGKVRCNGARCKSSREIEVDYVLEIRQGWDEKTILVKALSDKRGSAPQALLLYEESPGSIKKRELNAAQRKAQRAMQPVSEGKPTKLDRRKIHRFKNQHQE